MSAKHGDKARFHKLRKRRIASRTVSRTLRAAAAELKAAVPTPEVPEVLEGK